MKSYIKYISALLLFGLNGIVASRISNPSSEIVFMRTGLGSAFLILVFLFSGKGVSVRKNLRDFGHICVSGIAMGMSWIFLYEAYRRIGVSISSLLYYCGPVIVMALSPILFREKLTKHRIIGFAAVLLGVAAINGGNAGKLNSSGVVFAMLSAVTYAVMVIFNKRSKRIAGLQNSMIQLTVSFLTAALYLAAKGAFPFAVLGNEIIWVVILGIVNTGLGCYLYFSSIGGLPVQSVAVIGYLEPLSAVIFSSVILGEAFSAATAAGAVLIIGGAMFAEVR